MRDHPDAGRTAIDLFWVLAIGVIAAYAFFALDAREDRDPRLVHARERRGF